MRKAAPDILDMMSHLGVDFSCVDDVEKLSSKVRETAVATGMCEDMKFTLEGNDLTANITQCSFFPLTCQIERRWYPAVRLSFCGPDHCHCGEESRQTRENQSSWNRQATLVTRGSSLNLWISSRERFGFCTIS